MFAIFVQISRASASDLSESLSALQETMRTVCVSGEGEYSEIEFRLDANGNVVISRLMPGAVGEVVLESKQIKDASIEGAINYVDEAIRAESDADIRECMKQFIPLIVDLVKMYSDPSSKEQAKVDCPSGFSNVKNRVNYCEARGSGCLSLRDFQKTINFCGNYLGGKHDGLVIGHILPSGWRVDRAIYDVPLEFSKHIPDYIIMCSAEGTVPGCGYSGNPVGTNNMNIRWDVVINFKR
ncbi:MAG: hypothetical protein AAGC95_11840 [Pseudomonadota bacterium]